MLMMSHPPPYKPQGTKFKDKELSEFIPFASRRRSSAFNGPPKTRPGRRSLSDGFSRLLRGRSYMKPMMGSTRVRSRSRGSIDSKQPRRSSLRKSSLGPALAFGEIDFLKSKLGFTLPSAEAIVKTASLRPEGRLRPLSEASTRYSECLKEEELPPEPTPELPKSHSQEGGTRISRVLRMSHMPTGNVGTFRPQSRLHATPDYMLRVRNREASQIAAILKQVETSLRTVVRKKERAILPRGDGSVVVYTKKELDDYYEIDEETLRSVKRRVAADRRRIAKQRKQDACSVTNESATGTMATSTGRASYCYSLGVYDRFEGKGKQLSICVSDMFK